ncbi:DUF4435 domain-containing protein [Candidatus Magnetomoraceae bacterium gMMP-1]
MNNITIEKNILLLVEGRDEVVFFEALLKHINAQDNVQLVEVGGKNRFRNEFPTLLASYNFPAVKKYAIVRDADDSADNTFKSVIGLLRDHEQPLPEAPGEITSLDDIAAGVFIMPGNAAEGMLEDLCLRTVTNHPVSTCVDAYISCLHDNLEQEKKDIPKNPLKYYFPKNEAKAKMHAFLAGMNKFVPSLGIAAKKGYFNFDSEIFNDIKIFLQKLTA